MSEPVPITAAIGKALKAAKAEVFDATALDANEDAKARRAKMAIDIQDRQSVRKVAREFGIAELTELSKTTIAADALARVVRAASLDVALRILGGEFKFRDAGQAAQVLKILNETYRLESGQATSITSEITTDQVVARMQEMKEQVRARLQSGEMPPTIVDATDDD